MSDETQEIRPLPQGPERRETPNVPSPDTVPSPEEEARADVRRELRGLAAPLGPQEAEQGPGARIDALQQATGPVQPATPEEEDVSVNKGAFDKITDGMQKVFAMMEKFMKQIQSMGSASLRGMAKALAMLGMKPAADWLNELASNDFAELTSALKKNNLSLAALPPDDPALKANSEAAERGQAQLADQYRVLAQTRGPAFTREAYYSEVITVWKQKNGNGAKTAITHEDLLAMALIARELPAQLPGQAQAPQQAQAPAAASGMEKPENYPTMENLRDANLLLPTKINFNNQVVTVQAVTDGLLLNGVRYRLTHIPRNMVPVLSRVVGSANGITITAGDPKIPLFAETQTLPLDSAKQLLSALSAGTTSYKQGDFRFDRVS